MTVSPPNSGGFQTQISQAIVAIRNDMQTILNLNSYITAMGGVTFLQNTIGMSEADAASVVATLGNHAELAAIYNGGNPGAALNYQANGQPLWGGN